MKTLPTPAVNTMSQQAVFSKTMTSHILRLQMSINHATFTPPGYSVVFQMHVGVDVNNDEHLQV